VKTDFDAEVLHPGHRSIRLKGYDYTSEGLYFITICSHEKRCIFGCIVESRAVLSPVGLIVRECWIAIPSHFAQTRLHAFVIMPNHLHGIVEICAKLGRSNAAPLPGTAPLVQAGSLGAIVRSFKAAATRTTHEKLKWTGPLWQRNYFEAIVRDGEEFSAATRYILENPARWEWDKENPERTPLPRQSTQPA
jgi:REP-associated tyrosine transposase